jgi:hypothetical protein
VHEVVTAKLDYYLLELAADQASVDAIRHQYQQLKARSDHDSLQQLIELYDQAYPVLERQLWQSDDFDSLLDLYQSLFREQEALLQLSGKDDRFEFILTIPIADRPEHLRACLESIYQLCKLYGYGGMEGDSYCKIRVVVAEDSREQKYIQQDIALAEAYCKRGLNVVHFGQHEQYQLLQALPEQQRQHLGSILTTQRPEAFYRKGQAAMRNLSYLKMLQMTDDPEHTLFFPVDSDQSFQVNIVTQQGERIVPGLNYFYTINRIFQQTDTVMLTGKLVGDPPVSPAVMTSSFLLDVSRFAEQLSTLDPQSACAFHQSDFNLGHDAAYHDMSTLFGFKNRQEGYDYPCPLTGEHDNLQCLDVFAAQLSWFFSGQHPTRKTYFKYDGSLMQLSPARTIYPGNYIVNYQGLKNIIPFGNLRLRMSGPTAGRLVQAEIGGRFATVNLPMLHTRTLPGDEKNFRPGVEATAKHIDLSDEFERQFFGDLMLFSVAELVTKTDLRNNPDQQLIEQTLHRIEQEMLVRYREKHAQVLKRVTGLEEMLSDKNQWWHAKQETANALQQLDQFCRNVRHNFGEDSRAYRLIQSPSHRDSRREQILQALLQYPQARDAWDSLFVN